LSKSNTRHHRIFVGWWSVLYIGILAGFGQGFNIYGISVFFLPISQELGLSRAATSWAPGIGRLEGGVSSPLVGWLSDKFGPRWIVIIGISLAATGMVLMNYITQVWHYYVAWGAMIGLGLNIGLTVAVDKFINDWFMKRRGLAQGIKFALIGVLGVAVVQSITPLVDIWGWRPTCLFWGIIMFASLPLVYILIKPHPPDYYNLLPDGASCEVSNGGVSGDITTRGAGYATSFGETEYTFREAVKTRIFWLLMACFTVQSILASSINLHAHPFLTDFGMSEAAASGMMGMMIFFTVPSRFFSGLLADRVPKNRLQFLLSGAFLAQVVGLSTFLLFRNMFSVYMLLACHGLSTGAITPLIILILGRYFGRKAFGMILGTIVALLAPIGMLAPVYFGWIFDTTGSYNNALMTGLVLAVIATALAMLVRAPRVPVRTNPEAGV
jgi:MFS family permease